MSWATLITDVGTFASLPEGSIISTNFLGSGLTATITYQAGGGQNSVAVVVHSGAATHFLVTAPGSATADCARSSARAA